MALRIVVVGNGLIGSAAGRHLAELGHDVVVVGPREPADPTRHTGVFGSHYDEGRLVSAHGRDATWSWIAHRAIAGFGALEERSGVIFHHPVGRLSLVRTPSFHALRSWAQRSDPSRRDLTTWTASDDSWRSRFPYLDVPAGVSLLHEGPPAGHVKPRAMIRAQNLAAAQMGVVVVPERVVSVVTTSAGVTATTETGERFTADRAVIAAGAFTNFGDLLPEPLPLRLKTETTIRAEVSRQTAEALRTMPVVTYDVDDPDLDDVYLAPPIRYPDGRPRIKLGCNTANETWPTTAEEVGEWFRSGASELDLAAMERVLRSLLPGTELLDVRTHRCIVTYTPTGYPIIDAAPGDEHGRIVVAVGGNGTGAQGSDALGRLVAGLVHGADWPDGVERELFAAHHRWDVVPRRLSNAQRRARERTG